MAEEEILRKIDSKLGALLAIMLDQYLRETGVARLKPRSIDRLLTDAGLTPKEIGGLLGKTDRAVNLVLAAERQAKDARPRKAAKAQPAPEVEV